MVEVFIVNCESYKQDKIDKAINKILSNFTLPHGKTVLIKPNLLGAYRKGHLVVTNPAIIDALCRVLKENKNKIIIGDSSLQNTDLAIEKSGVLGVAKKYNATVINFEKVKSVKVKIPGGKIIKELDLPEILFKADYVINVPRLKTHSLMKLTCAIKNMYGVIPGTKKQQLHAYAPTEKEFAQLLLDLNKIVKPDLTLVDAVIGMEGEGPAAGDAKHTGLILASNSQFAIDLLVTDIIGWKRKDVPTNKLILEQKLFTEKIEIKGEMHHTHYKKPPGLSTRKILGIINMFIPQEKITVREDKCIKCGVCMRKCPKQAITLNPYPTVDTKKCIRCFCCIEACPEHALYLKAGFIRKFANSFRKKFLKI
ncbi:MAG: DUF362 domain-containing protein [Candidatus Nanoarchaeia archaeon]|nr:DUF362 domain-containing protein [Candidatus Nanoarchaeia archaeon]